MENFLVSFNAVFPLCVSMALGYFLRRVKLLNAGSLKTLNALSFKVFLPIYLFDNIYRTDLAAAFNGRLLCFALTAVGLFTLLLMLTVPLLEKENSRRGVMVQAMFRSNFALFGLPVAISLCGEARVGPTSLLVGLVVPFYNVLAVIVLEFFRGKKPDPMQIIKGILRNPLIVASVLGVAVRLLGLELPDAARKCVTDLGRVATPLSLVALGGDFKFADLKTYKKQLLLAVPGKLIVSPLLMVGAGVLFGFRQEFLVPILILSGAPTAVSSYPMAQQMGGDGPLAAQTVVLTSALSLGTMFLWIFALKSTGMI